MTSRAICVFCLVLFLPVLVGCSDDGDAISDAGIDGRLSDGGADGEAGIPFDLPKGDKGHADVSAKLTKGQVRAGVVTAASQLLPGIKVEGKVGDFKLYNRQVAFIIRDTRFSDGYSPFGGKLLDASLLDASGAPLPGFLGEMIMGVGINTLLPTSVGVVNDGSDGKAAVVRAIGDLTPIPILAGLLGGIGGKPAIVMVVDYVLEADSQVLEVRYRFFNKKDVEFEIPLTIMAPTAGDTAEFFAERAGFDLDRAKKAGHWIAMIGPGVGYALFSPETKHIPIIRHEGIWVLTSQDGLTVPAAGEAQRIARLAVTDGEPEAVWRVVRAFLGQQEPAKVTGAVADPAGKPVAGARVHVTLDDNEQTYVTMTRTDEQGGFGVALSPGSYRVFVAAEGRELAGPAKLEVTTAPTAPLTLAVGGTAELSLSIVDDQGQPIPAKLIFKRSESLASSPASFGEKTYPGGAALVRFIDGKGTAALPPGTYTVTASRGFEYEIDSATVTLSDGGIESAAFSLTRSVDTKGFLCGDFHIHAMWSPDSSDLYDFKVRAIAAEGVEVPVITDHEYIADLGPYIAKAGLQKWVRGLVGEELTTIVYGHFNPFPIKQDPTKPNMGAMSWFQKDPHTLFADVHTTWPDAVLQVNHPRSGSFGSGYFTYVGLDRETGKASKPEAWSRDFDAFEVFNGNGWSSNKNKTVLDWFSFLDRGFLVTATGNSDSHRAVSTEVGYPRNYVQVSTDEPANLSPLEFAKAVKDQRLLVSGGPFVTVEIGGRSMGEVADATSKKAQVAVKVQAPTWMPVDTLQVIVGGTTAHKVTLDSSTADPQNPVIRYDSSLEVLATQDTWVVVVVTGSGTLAPVSRNDEPFAVTNPIYLDVDGNDVYDPPKSF